MLLLGSAQLLCAQPKADAPAQGGPVTIVELEGKAQVLRRGHTGWDPAYTNQVLLAGDRLQTGARSRAVLRLSNLTPLRIGERSLIEIPPDPKKQTAMDLLRGLIYLFHRDKPGLFPIGTPTASAIIRGTEFHLEVAEDGTSTLTMLDGVVELTNEFGRIEIASGESAVAKPGQKPARTAAIEAVNVIQWCLYYPAVLDVGELNGLNRLNELNESLAAYRAGDLLQALEKYPEARQPTSDEEKVYRAALLLAVGQVEEAQKSLNELKGLNELNGSLAGALGKLIAAVKLQPDGSSANPSPRPSPLRGAREKEKLPPGKDAAPGPASGAVIPSPLGGERVRVRGEVLATEWLAESYYQQSQRNLEEALNAARNAVEKSPNFSFAWARVGELEFSFGRTAKAMEAVGRSLELAPRNAEARSLRGFLFAAQNRITKALDSFDQAIAIDGALGSAWLGRGLCRIRRAGPPSPLGGERGSGSERDSGLQDLQTAALLEPQRALLRSYLGKAFSHLRNNERAARELELARKADPEDPTAWLYSALVKHQENRINEAVHELEQSQDLNENRSLYRSRLLLDQDRAVRAVNLASIYQDAGLSDVSVWEASRAVNADYANFSAHLFLADSFQRLRDLRSVNQRFETPAVNEYLLATLLAPVGAGTLAHSVSQQEYSKLFESDGFGFASSTEYLSRGAWVQSAAQYGTFGNFGYALSAFYQSDPGQYPNNDIQQTELSLQLQQQITPNDTAYFRAIYGDAEGGDLAQYYDPTAPFAAGGSNPQTHFEENQEPILLAGYRHEWGPGSHTLVLVGRLQDTFRATNGQQRTLLLPRDANGAISGVIPITIEQTYRNELEIYTAEVQQIFQSHAHTLIVGARYQTGEFDTFNRHTNASFFPFLFPQDPQQVTTDFERTSAYGYYNWQVVEPLLLTAGLSYDRLTYPLNFRFAPLSQEEHTTDRVSPKAGFIWTPLRDTTVRFAYNRSLGGVSFDQSFRLEPVQVAGFNQAFRSIIPESVAGANSAARFETFGFSLEQKFDRGTYLGLGGEILQSQVNRQIGVYDNPNLFTVLRGSTREHLDFVERSVSFTASQLVGRDVSLGARYRLSQAALNDEFADVPSSAILLDGFRRQQELEAVLHRVDLSTIYNHPSGFFGEAQAVWYRQNSQGYLNDLPSDDFWQFHLFAGYRFAQRRAELRLGLLNIADQDYRLNPLNLTYDLPRERTLLASFRFYF